MELWSSSPFLEFRFLWATRFRRGDILSLLCLGEALSCTFSYYALSYPKSILKIQSENITIAFSTTPLPFYPFFSKFQQKRPKVIKRHEFPKKGPSLKKVHKRQKVKKTGASVYYCFVIFNRARWLDTP